MTNFQKVRNGILIVACIIFSGLCWYTSNGLYGDFWYLLWLAPIPILLISFKYTAKTIFFISFISYLIGRLSWFSYLVTVATLIPAIVFTIALPLVFALIMIITRTAIIKTNSRYAIFAFPVFFTAFEWLLIKFSPDGTAATIAYSQLNFLPLIQIASITGILGITFMVTFIPSVLAIGWYYRKNQNNLLPLSIISFIIIFSVFLFGILRISNSSEKNTTTAGLVVLDEKSHNMGNNPELQDELQHTRNYAQEITKLAGTGAKLIVLPERAVNINKELDSASINILRYPAKQNHVTIVVGYTNYKNKEERNSALVIDTEGNVVMDYNKVHLVKGLEDQFTPGLKIGLFRFDGMLAGTAICKDLDFNEYIQKYGKSKVVFLCIPAWDFVVDDWLHSRMAILRGVENGFSEVRTARLGRLTISDPYGRISAEATCANGKATTLIGQVSLSKINTLYTRYGDWFGISILFAAILFILNITIKRHKQ
jgi:apolipoprotein N-acyltransferase